MRIISNHESARAIITSDAFGAYSMADPYRELGQRLGHDFGPAIAVLDQLPTFIDGDRHKAARRLLAIEINRDKARQVEAGRSFLDGFISSMLRPDSMFDLINDFSLPLFRAVGIAGGGHDWLDQAGIALIEDIPALFSPTTPLKWRFDINARLAALIDTHGPDVIHRLALLVLGIRPLTGSLALSLHGVFDHHPGRMLADMDWPAQLPASALQYVDRICRQAVTIGTERFVPGERVRCLIQSAAWEQPERQAMMFGVGAHLCLGRPISELLWTMTAAAFATQPWRAVVAPLRFRNDCDPFHLPVSCTVRITA